MELIALIDWLYFHTTIDMDALCELAEMALRGSAEVATPEQRAALTLLAERIRRLQATSMPLGGSDGP